MLIEIHMIKNYPPTNLNRDDTGAPKTCLFGGTTRGRISSQCLKRSWRTSEMFRNEVGKNNLGFRTRKFPTLVAEKLRDLGVCEEYIESVTPKIAKFGTKEKEEKEGKETNNEITAQVIFFAPQDINDVAVAVKKKLDECTCAKDVSKLKTKDLQDAVSGANVRPVTLDIALFGRMVTSDAFRDVEASMQVAHAVSTNKVTVESDYFTAMDDLLGSESMEEKGAAIIDDTDFDASCYYVYASLDTDALRHNLDYSEDADAIVKKAVPALLRAMAYTSPSGKQNSFAGHVLPSAVMVECKEEKVPVSLVNAFSEAVRPGGDMVRNSIKLLAEEADMIDRDFALPVKDRIWFCMDKYDLCPDCAKNRVKSFPKLVEAVSATLM